MSDWPIWAQYADDERAAVDAVLRSGKSNYWSGEHGKAFEREFADYIGVAHGVALANGTLALEAALYGLGIGADDEVIVPARTFIATASSVAMRGAIPVVADIDQESGNLTVETIAAAMSSRTRAIIVVHLGGWPCDMPAIMAFARQHNLYVIEDCAQAHGASIDGQKVGSFGHAAAFSFCQDKIISTGGEGGMLVTDHEALWRKVWSYKDHGRDYDAVHHQQHGPGHRWYCHSFGSNWRMTEMQAAIGRIQLKKLPGWLDTRRDYAKQITEALADLEGVCFPLPSARYEHAYYRLYGLIKLESLKADWDQDRVIDAISALGVPCFHGSCSEIYREQAFAPIMRDSYPLPNAHKAGQLSLALLIHPGMSEVHVEQTISAVTEVFEHAQR